MAEDQNAAPEGAQKKPKRPPYVPIELTDDKRQELEDEHEDILVLRGTERAPWVIVVRRPTRQETIGYKAHARKDNLTANEQLLARITVYPTGADYDRQVARWPFIPDGVAASKVFNEFVGIAVDESLKG